MVTVGVSGVDHGDWDSGLSSTTDTGTAECYVCRKSTATSKDDWMKILEALETVGEAEMLKKLEDSILCASVPMCSHYRSIPVSKQVASSYQKTPFTVSSLLVNYTTNANSPPQLANSNLRQPILRPTSPHLMFQSASPSLGSDICMSSLSSDVISTSTTMFEMSSATPCTKTSFYDQPSDRSRLSMIFKHLEENEANSVHVDNPSNSNFDSLKPCTSASDAFLHDFTTKNSSSLLDRPSGTTHRVILHKDAATGGFGFSVSDGTGDNPGVFINAILPGGVADKSGLIRPFDKILKVNDTSLQYLDCDLAVPLLSASKIDLLLYRDASLRNARDDDEVSSCVGSISLSLKDSAV
ncbi:hypothetical protein AB6A40_003305 [Gnathostoma spinigerum]|uniref:PDZ domain-containing protein n=1 Tax=Gnathostoma spinigerum TaxID=75299 RepID=A0ABD6EAF0_9BILA